MVRSLSLVYALAVAAPVFLLPAAHANDRALPMRFELRKADPDACGNRCRPFVAASGAITADTPHDFQSFAQGRDLRGLTIALDSDGGSVLGAISLGREIRALGLNTTVGHAVDRDSGDDSAPYATLSPRADCQSMCAFVLLGGVHRSVPPQARVMVHQIWLGDRREDPTAANYSAEDLVLVQHDIGSLAQYTIDMGATIDMLDLSLRIPPWEPMHQLTADEIRRMRVATDLPRERAPATAAASSTEHAPATVAATPPAAAAATVASPASTAPTASLRPSAISERRWAMIDNSGLAALARRHPLTIEGEEIGSFDLSVACAGLDGYDVSYVERRHANDDNPLPASLSVVTITIAGKTAPLKVVSSQRSAETDELLTFASGTVPASLIAGFASAGNHSLSITTRGAAVTTGIRIGNTGAVQSLPRLAASCSRSLGDRADLSLNKVAGSAAK